MNIELLKTLGTVKKVNKNDFICVENEVGKTAYLLLQGRVEIMIGSFGTTTKKIALLKPGTIFGEMSLLEGKPRNASVLAKDDDTLVLEIKKDNFISILQSDKDIAWNLLCTLIDRANTLMRENRLHGFEAIAGYKQNSYYVQLKKLTRQQFDEIIDKNTTYVLKLLGFLSHALAEMDEELLKRINEEDGDFY